MFNNFSASADLQAGATGLGASYAKFTNLAVRNCGFIGVNTVGVNLNGAAGNSILLENNRFTLYTVGAKAIITNESVNASYLININDCLSYGFAAGNTVNGAYTTANHIYEYNSSGTATAGRVNGVLRYTTYPTDYQIKSFDPQIITIVNTRAGAKLLGPSLTFAVGAQYLVVNSSTSTQSVLLRDAADTTTLATLAAGGKAYIWNDGITNFAGVLT